MSIVTLSTCEVEIVDRINWGAKEAIKTAMQSTYTIPVEAGPEESRPKEVQFSPEALMRAKYKMLEVCIKQVKLPDGNTMAYTREWMDNLSPEDGDKLYDAVDAISHPKKK